MHPFFARLFVTILTFFVCVIGLAQVRPDTTKGPSSPGSRPSLSGPRPYSEIITNKAITDDGLFTVHKVDDKYFFEIGDTMFGRDILVVNRISKAAAGMRSGFFWLCR